jgi:hypothetical protein
MDSYMHQLQADFPSLAENIAQIKNFSQEIFGESRTVNEVASTNSLIWEILKLPKVVL